MNPEYDEYGRLIEEPKKPRKLQWGDADYPFTFAVSIVNRETAEGVKDFEAVEKIKTAKGAAKKAWQGVQGSRGPLSRLGPAGEWLIAQNWEDLDLVVRPITVQRDFLQGAVSHGMFAGRWRNTQELTVQWAYSHVAQHPMEAQEFYDPDSGTWEWAKTESGYPDFDGPSTIIPLVAVME